MSDKKCYICNKPLDDVNNYVVRFDNEAFDLCEEHYKTSKRLLAHIDKRKKELEGKICCKNYDKNCEYDGVWLCKNPDCKTPVFTSTLPGAHPSGCPKIDKWNSKSESRRHK